MSVRSVVPWNWRTTLARMLESPMTHAKFPIIFSSLRAFVASFSLVDAGSAASVDKSFLY